MPEIRRSIKCSNCGSESIFSLGSDFEVRDMMINAKCTNCGSSIQLNFTVISNQSSSTESSSGNSYESEAETENPINLEEELFQPDMLSKSSEDDISDIIEG